MSVKTFPLDAYSEEEIFVFIDQPVNAKHQLRDIEQQHRDQLLRWSDPMSTNVPEG